MLELARRHIRLIVVLSVSFASIRHQLDQRDTAAGARTIDCTLRDFVSGDDIVAVGLLANHAVTDRFGHELRRGRLLAQRCRGRIAVVLDDYYQWATLHCGERSA